MTESIALDNGIVAEPLKVPSGSRANWFAAVSRPDEADPVELDAVRFLR